jgi:hypothetical protein
LSILLIAHHWQRKIKPTAIFYSIVLSKSKITSKKMTRVSIFLVALAMLMAVFATVAEGKQKSTPTFLPRSYGASQPFAGRESDAIVDCNAEESEEARFALQYEHEQLLLRQSESSYLLRDRQKQLDSKVVPASMIQRKAEFLDIVEV